MMTKSVQQFLEIVRTTYQMFCKGCQKDTPHAYVRDVDLDEVYRCRSCGRERWVRVR